MSLFLPSNVKPLAQVANIETWSDQDVDNVEMPNTDFFKIPKKGLEQPNVDIDYIQLSDLIKVNPVDLVQKILDNTPKPKGRNSFSSVHIVGPHSSTKSERAESTIQSLYEGCKCLKKEVFVHRLNEAGCQQHPTPMEEYKAIFEASSSLLIAKADRASLLIFVGWENTSMDGYAAFIGMLPFRGVQVALLSMRADYGDLLRFTTPSGTFDFDGLTAARMGKFSVHAVYGHLPTKRFTEKVQTWDPVDISLEKGNSKVIQIPFKIGGLTLPMLTHSGSSESALSALAALLTEKYTKGYTPIVSCGETCDALGYGQDMLDALGQEDGFLFTHKSGETYKRYDNYGTEQLFECINRARNSTAPPVILAVGGGVNGNCIGLIAAMTNCDFIEIPTTPMHYNDAVTSAKKAVSLVVNDKILSKNILGAFYLPQLAFCINEWLLTISSANAHATVGEATKTMNMLGMANTLTGAADFHNIVGAIEFASDFTKILEEVNGFDNLIDFIESPSTLKKKEKILALGKKITALREAANEKQNTIHQTKRTSSFKKIVNLFSSFPSMASIASLTTVETSDSSEESETETEDNIDDLILERKLCMKKLRESFHELPREKKDSILSFLTTINREIVCAKAMFLAYSDPFEKYSALLFEYAHTLGHGVEAFANDLYLKANQCGVDIAPEALRLHGQCVGMAVLWAGEMSKNLGKLTGEGYTLHQSFPYLFNRSNGFSFGPLRALCDELGVEKEEFIEKVLQVVRRDNKRGYCNCSDPKKSVDQLVENRPGKMLSSDDPNAKIRYLVQVDEDWQAEVLGKAFDGYFDKVADLNRDNELCFIPINQRLSRKNVHLNSKSKEVAKRIRSKLLEAYHQETESSVM